MAIWYYYNTNGEKIEVTSRQLRELAQQGIVTPETIIETEEGKSAPARKVKGLTFAETKPPETEIYGLSQPEPIVRTSKSMYNLLESTHDQVKQKLSESRKSGDILPKKEKIKTKKDITILTFDEEAEKNLLAELNKKNARAIDKHFALIALCNLYYKYRDVDAVYLEKCIEYCYMDIGLLDDVQKDHHDDEVKQIMQLKKIWSPKKVKDELASITHFEGRIPAFERLIIIYDKQKDYDKAIEVCDMEISYYNKYGLGAGNLSARKDRREESKSSAII